LFATRPVPNRFGPQPCLNRLADRLRFAEQVAEGRLHFGDKSGSLVQIDAHASTAPGCWRSYQRADRGTLITPDCRRPPPGRFVPPAQLGGAQRHPRGRLVAGADGCRAGGHLLRVSPAARRKPVEFGVGTMAPTSLSLAACALREIAEFSVRHRIRPCRRRAGDHEASAAPSAPASAAIELPPGPACRGYRRRSRRRCLTSGPPGCGRPRTLRSMSNFATSFRPIACTAVRTMSRAGTPVDFCMRCR
jgi:hypothetical protein